MKKILAVVLAVVLCIGLQFHPEAAVVKYMNNVENASEFMDAETAILIFEELVNQIG